MPPKKVTKNLILHLEQDDPVSTGTDHPVLLPYIPSEKEKTIVDNRHSAMLSIKKCKGILNNTDRTYTDEQVKKIRQILYQLAEIDYNNYKENLKHDQKDDHLSRVSTDE